LGAGVDLRYRETCGQVDVSQATVFNVKVPKRGQARAHDVAGRQP